jgi:hypothetical protein
MEFGQPPNAAAVCDAGLAAALPIPWPALGMRDGDDKNPARLDTVDYSKRKSHNPTFTMRLVDGGKLLGYGGNTAIRSVDRVRESYGCLDVSLSIPIKRIIEIAAGVGKQIDRQHFTMLMVSTDAPQRM